MQQAMENCWGHLAQSGPSELSYCYTTVHSHYFPQEFAVTWAQMEFDHERHQRTGIVQISASEDVIEALEDNQVQTGLFI